MLRPFLAHALIRLAARIDAAATLRVCERAAHRAQWERLAASIDKLVTDVRKQAAREAN